MTGDKQKQLKICFICDDGYALPTRVAIKSLIKTQSEPVRIYVVGVDLSDEEVEKLRALSSEKAIVKVIQQHHLIGADHLDGHLYVSKAALFKFFLPQILKENKVLYLDSDMIVTGDISELYNVDLEDKCAAVVKDMAGTLSGHHNIKNESS